MTSLSTTCVAIVLCVTCLVCYPCSVEGITASDLNHECLRTCEWPPQPKTCVYHFNVDWFYSMSHACNDCPINETDCSREYCMPLNGIARPIAVVNKIFPGPSIQVCENDTIIAHVTNYLDNHEGTSIHWHGAHQRGTPYMDGTSMVTQCPITSFTTFTYNFTAAPYGTHWWHAHAGLQRADGIFGSMVFRQALQSDVNSELYDYDLPEHVVAVHDWFDQMTLAVYTAHRYGSGGHAADAILINGKGKRQSFLNHAGEKVYTEQETFNVTARKRYRFRMFSNAIVICPLKISVDSHKLTIIASDGGSLEPFETDAFVIHGGERFDFVIHANKVIGNYWMRVQGLGDCQDTQELALVKYAGSSNDDIPGEEDDAHQGSEHHGSEHASYDKTVVNPWTDVASDSAIPVVQLNSAELVDDKLKGSADVVYYLGMDFNRVNRYFDDPAGGHTEAPGHGGGHNPGGHTEAPGHGGGHNPGGHTEAPGHAGHTEAPGHGDGHNPGGHTEAPGHGGGHNPGGHTEAPGHDGGHNPGGHTEAPGHDGGHNPGGHTEAPGHGGGHNPGGHTEAPGHGGGHNPGGHTEAPGHGGGHNPGGHTEAPGHGGGHNPDTGDHNGHGNGGHSAHALHYLHTAQINHLSFKFNSRPPLTQFKEIPDEEFCPWEPYGHYPAHCEHKYCRCTQTISVRLGEVVELVLVDEGRDFQMGHPMHLHGHSFQVVAQGKLGESTTVEDVMRLDGAGNITRKLDRSVRKDTVLVQDGGYTIIRFHANNPGWWFFHCHLQFHMQDGMSLMIHVGNDADLPEKPRDFPRCGTLPMNISEPNDRKTDSKYIKYRKRKPK